MNKEGLDQFRNYVSSSFRKAVREIRNQETEKNKSLKTDVTYTENDSITSEIQKGSLIKDTRQKRCEITKSHNREFVTK